MCWCRGDAAMTLGATATAPECCADEPLGSGMDEEGAAVGGWLAALPFGGWGGDGVVVVVVVSVVGAGGLARAASARSALSKRDRAHADVDICAAGDDVGETGDIGDDDDDGDGEVYA